MSELRWLLERLRVTAAPAADDQIELNDTERTERAYAAMLLASYEKAFKDRGGKNRSRHTS